MVSRLLYALSFSLLGALAATGVAEATKGPDSGEVAAGTLLAVAVVMAFLLLVYVIKRSLGATAMPPAEETGTGHEAH